MNAQVKKPLEWGCRAILKDHSDYKNGEGKQRKEKNGKAKWNEKENNNNYGKFALITYNFLSKQIVIHVSRFNRFAMKGTRMNLNEKKNGKRETKFFFYINLENKMRKLKFKRKSLF